MERNRFRYYCWQISLVCTIIISSICLIGAESEEEFQIYNEIMSWSRQPNFDGYAISNVFYLFGTDQNIKKQIKTNKKIYLEFNNTPSMLQVKINPKYHNKNISVYIYNLMGKKHGASGIYRIESENIPLLLSFPKKEINPGIYIISVVQSNCCILLKKFIVLK